MQNTPRKFSRLRERNSKITWSTMEHGWNDLDSPSGLIENHRIFYQSCLRSGMYVPNVFDFRFHENWIEYQTTTRTNQSWKKSIEPTFFRAHISNCLFWKFSLLIVKYLNESKYLNGKNPGKIHNVIIRTRMYAKNGTLFSSQSPNLYAFGKIHRFYFSLFWNCNKHCLNWLNICDGNFPSNGNNIIS